MTVGATTEDAEVGINRSETLPLKMTEKVLMVMVELDIGLIPDHITSIIQVRFPDSWVFY